MPSRTSGNASPFVGVEWLVVAVHGAALCVVLFRRRRIARLANTQRWLAAVGLAAAGSLALSAGLAFYVSFAGSPF